MMKIKISKVLAVSAIVLHLIISLALISTLKPSDLEIQEATEQLNF